ncbi:MAG: 2,6-beta-D-fructofuranosidase, partial [Bacteroidales bacterium]
MLAAVLLLPTSLFAQQVAKNDTVPSTREEKNRNVMLNAKNDREPRQISIGLPAQFAADIFEDGLPVAELYWPIMPFTTWRNTLSLSKNSLMSLSESALMYGKMENIVSSENRHAGDTFKGVGKYAFNHFGKQLVDFNVSGPIAKGWGYTLGSYQSFDPGSNRLDVMSLQDRMGIYKVGLNKRWNDNKGEVSLLYQYSHVTTFTDENGPFYFNGADGSVEQFEDFKLGRDQYLPNYRAFHYLSLEDNKEYDVDINDANRDHAHQLTLNFRYTWDNGTTLTVGTKLKDARQFTATYNLAGIFAVTEEDGYTYEDGTPYVGYVQNRHARRPYGIERSWMTSAQLTGKAGKQREHSWRMGLNEWFSYQSMSYPTGLLPHE